MRDGCQPRLDGTTEALGEATLEAIAAQAWPLRPVPPNERRSVLRNESGLLVDRLLTRVVRRRGALDVAIGDGLAALAVGDRALRLGYSSIGDYARERLGIAARTAQALARLSRGLEERPLLRAAVRSGEVSIRKAQAVLAVARGEAEATWVARAKDETVRALEVAVRAGGARQEHGEGGQTDEEERWDKVTLPVTSEARERLDEAMALAGKLLGATAPAWQRLEAICQEYLGGTSDRSPGQAHAREAVASDQPTQPKTVEGAGDELESVPLTGYLEDVKELYEKETDRWAFLNEVEHVAAPESSAVAGEVDPHRIDEELRRLTAARDGWDELVGHLGMHMRGLGLWRDAKFTSFAHYAAERLGMAARTLEQRAWLERRLYSLPGLREAMRAGRLSYEKARLVAGRATEDTVVAWIERAEKLTCVTLRREVEADEETQMRARATLSVALPRRVALLLALAMRAARDTSGERLSASQCLGRIADHFVDTWKGTLAGRSTRRQRVLQQGGGFCQVPGCSRGAAHAHHIHPRSRGGGHEPWNLLGLCSAHHLHGVHRGWIRVTGRAPDELQWELGVRSVEEH